MPNRIVECVPNFSEGRNMKVIEDITSVIKDVPEVELKDIDPGDATNRTVVTFVGSPEGVVEAAFRAIKRASELIDMTKHKGAHPRFGATDVCPFVPVEGVTMDECVVLAKRLGKRVGEELGIPVYLYEHAATDPRRRNLAYVRKGEYEGLPTKMKDPEMTPDFGPAEFVPKTGAVAIGAREFLIAYNVTLNTKSAKYANDIAFELREKGRSVRRGNIEPHYFRGELLKYREDELPCGECDFVTDDFDKLEKHYLAEHGFSIEKLLAEHSTSRKNLIGRSVKSPGIFKETKAIGWFVEEYGRAQISINLTNYNVTAPHEVLEKARELAAKRGVVVTGSEIVGLIPYQAMLMAGRFYLDKQEQSTGVPECDIIDAAIFSMGLNDVSRFDPQEKIIGLPKIPKDALVAKSCVDFIDEVSRDSPAPGGGSVAALAGSLGAALAAMDANLTIPKADSRDEAAPYIALAVRAQELKKALVTAVDEDTQAFNDYLVAMRMPQKTDAEKIAREEAIQAGLKKAVRVPLETARHSLSAMKLAAEIAETGNAASVTDAAVGAQMAYSGVIGGVLNVIVNLGEITDTAFIEEMKSTCEELKREALSILETAMETASRRIEKLHAK